MNLIHRRTKFMKDHMYIKNVLSQATKLFTDGDFKELAHLYDELSGVCASLSAMAADNHHGVEDSDTQGYSI